MKYCRYIFIYTYTCSTLVIFNELSFSPTVFKGSNKKFIKHGVDLFQASYHLTGTPQRVIATNGPLGSLLAAAAGVLKTMPESTLTQAISLVSKGVGQPALASASALWAASLQGQAVAAMAANADLTGPSMASAGEGSGVATRRRGRVARR